MIADLSALRMALDEYDNAEGRHERERAEKRVRKILTIGLIKTLVAAVDDAHDDDEDEDQVEPETTPPDAYEE